LRLQSVTCLGRFARSMLCMSLGGLDSTYEEIVSICAKTTDFRQWVGQAANKSNEVAHHRTLVLVSAESYP
jgi:hypothetical protein